MLNRITFLWLFTCHATLPKNKLSLSENGFLLKATKKGSDTLCRECLDPRQKLEKIRISRQRIELYFLYSDDASGNLNNRVYVSESVSESNFEIDVKTGLFFQKFTTEYSL